MGTRNLTCVVKDGEYKVAQYGQWDGYPSGAGLTVLTFLREQFNREQFLNGLGHTCAATDEQVKAQYLAAGATEKQLADGYVNIDVSSRFSRANPSLSRDTGAKILELIQDSITPVLLRNDVNFAADSLFCEWAYVIDFDKNTFEAFKGFNTTDPLKEGDRFFGYTVDDSANGYHPIKLAAEWPLDALPTEAEFLAKLEPEDEEEDESAEPATVVDESPALAPSLAEQVVQYFDEWELTLPPDARAVLAPIAEQARKTVSASRKTVSS